MKFVYTLVFLALSSFSCSKEPVIEEPIVSKSETKILFVGNSYTYYNSGVDFQLKNIVNADTIEDDKTYVFESVTVGAYRLESHWNDQVSIEKIASDKWNYVVLQEQSTRPIDETELFYEYARLLDKMITGRDSKTAFYMTWARKDHPLEINELAEAYISISEELNATLAPVGRVWEYVLNKYPEIVLHIADDKHPTPAGTYLAACVFDIVLLDKNPINSSYVPAGVSEPNAIKLKNAAWDFMQEWE
ncbi:MAG: hypothetical protein K9H49_16300 [Bacteroidales bacterium]|nr:hypothetical protein [Bacteroidales bacterium]MCF8390930.1 hypothetical protein [Bacteroidales bacterium]